MVGAMSAGWMNLSRYLKCGHGITAYDDCGKPICPVCGCRETIEPDLAGRTALCIYCGQQAQSGVGLPFFEYMPGEECDQYYCGCRGWD